MWNTEGFMPTGAAPLDVEGELERPGIGSSTLGDNILGSEFLAPGTGISTESNEPVVRSMQGPDLLMSNELLFDSAEDVGSDETGVDPITGMKIAPDASNTLDVTIANTDNLNLDIDDNGRIEARTDGQLIRRYMSGLRGNRLIRGAIGSGANRSGAADIEDYLDAARDTMLDADGNGRVGPRTDGRLIGRYMLDITGRRLTRGAIGNGAIRTTAAEVEQFLDQFATLTPNPNILFFEDFESDLSRWTGKGRGSTSGIIVPDPLQADRALSFTELAGGGDIFTLESFISPSAVYRLSFDYLSIAGPESVANDLGGFAGYSTTLAGDADTQWLAGTSRNSLNLEPNFLDLADTGRWESISIPFTTSESIHLIFEDFVSSRGVAGDVYFDNIRLEALDTPTDILFAENFESDLSRWTGKGRGSTSGIIVSDPLQADRALSFTELIGGGDIFTLESFISPSAVYRLSFDYLGLAGPESVAGDIGGFVGYGDTLSEDADVWLAGTSRNSSRLAPNFLDLPDTGRWESIKIPFTTSESIHLTFEDWVFSGGVAGDAYFDNVRLETF